MSSVHVHGSLENTETIVARTKRRKKPPRLLTSSVVVEQMLTYRGFEAWVECDGAPLTSYAAWCEGRVIGATVASEAGKVQRAGFPPLQ